MKFRFKFAAAVLGMIAIVVSQTSFAQTGQLRLLCSNGIRAAVEELKSAAENEIGREVSIEFSASTLLQKQIDAGVPFDLVIVTPGVIEALANSGKLVTNSITDIASSDLGVGIRAGSATANVSSADGMKARLLAAQSVTWTDGGAAGPSVLAMFEGLGISAQMQPKIVLQKTPGRPALSVAAGENELMFAPVSEIQTVQGVELLGKFPQEFQKPVVMTAGIAAEAMDPEGAKELIAFLTGAKAVQAMLAAGMDTASKN